TVPGLYTFTAGDGGQHTFTNGVTLYTAGTWAVTAQDGSITGGASITVTPAAADHFQLDAPGTVVAGTTFSVTLTALDPYGNIAPTYGATAAWTSTDQDPTVVLPSDYQFQPSDAGVVSFDGLILQTIDTIVLTATDVETGQLIGNASIIVTASTGPSGSGSG